MKNKFLELLKSKGGEINTLILPELLPEITGDGAMYLPTKYEYNNNILILGNVNVDFIKTYNELIEANLIELDDIGIQDYLLSGTPIYSSLKLANEKNIKTQEKVWLPTIIKLVEND
jgi:hypothetical protein